MISSKNVNYKIEINNIKCMCCIKSSKEPKQCSRYRISGTDYCRIHKNTTEVERIDYIINNGIKKPIKSNCKNKLIQFEDLEKLGRFTRKDLTTSAIAYNLYDKISIKQIKNIDIINSLYNYLTLYNKFKNDINHIKNIQRLFKVMLSNKLKRLKGDVNIRKLCNNTEDVYSFIDLKDINDDDFVYYKDTKGIYWGFDIKTINKMFELKDFNNPYDRIKIPEYDIQRFNKIIRILKCQNYKFNNEFIPIDSFAQMKLRVTDIFQKLDECGYYTDPNWFLNLTLPDLKTMYYNAEDIWNYRAYDLTPEVKKQICKPDGLVFTKSPKIYICNNLEKMRGYCLDEIEKIISSDNKSHRAQGAMYVLCSLVTVSIQAANTMPWLVYALVDTN